MAEPEAPDDPPEGPLTESEVPNAADPVAVRRKGDKVRKAEKESAAFWAGVLADPVGRREVWALLQSAHTFEERFACGPNGFPQPEATWFHAGEQAFGLRFYQSLARMDRAGVFVMHDEFDPRFVRPKPPRKRQGQE